VCLVYVSAVARFVDSRYKEDNKGTVRYGVLRTSEVFANWKNFFWKLFQNEVSIFFFGEGVLSSGTKYRTVPYLLHHDSSLQVRLRRC
jgi:hypothetical protein